MKCDNDNKSLEYRFNQNKPSGVLHNVCTERNFDSRPFMYKKNIFDKTLTEVCNPYLYASFGTFYVQVGQIFAAQ